MLAVAAIALLPASATAGKRHHKHKPAGVKGVVLNSTCPGACAGPPPAPPYTGPVTVTVQRASDGVQVASREITDGHFRMRVKRAYDVSSVPPNPPTCQPTPETVCPLGAADQPAAIIAPCLTGETQRIQVRRHHFTRVELHVRNVCIV